MARKITDTDISVEDLNNVSGNPQMGQVLGYTGSVWSPATVEDPDKVEALDWAGFENRITSTLQMNGNSFQIIPSTSYNIWISGELYAINETKSVTISEDKKITFVYFLTPNSLTASITPWSIANDKALVAMVFKDGDNYIIYDERHSYHRDINWHTWAHTTIGTRYQSGFSGTFTNNTFSITQGIILDEDIIFNSVSTRTNGVFWYRDGGSSMRMVLNTTTPTPVDGSGYIQYDNNSGTLQTADNNRFVCYYVYAGVSSDYPIQIVVGQAQHSKISLARSEPFPVIQKNVAEWKLLYRIIYSSQTPIFQEAQDFRTVSSGPAVNAVANDHQALINRDSQEAHPLATDALHGFLDKEDKALLNNLDRDSNSKLVVQALSYTVSTVPSASTSGAGTIIYVSDESGGPVLAYSDGINWKRCTDGTTIS